ncbi:MAG: hypothetical protein M1823_000689 [Watsoniomyces obsoletus]|nr:MAG: hypothetical protein M1823_000689 [Watsoniomyces obsoletus]
MAPPPATPARPSPGRRPARSSPARPNTLTDAFADAFLPKSVARKAALMANTPSPKAAKAAEEPPSTPNQVSNPGQPLSTNDGNSVKDKIRKWQDEGGGVVEEPPMEHSSADKEIPEGVPGPRKKRNERRVTSNKRMKTNDAEPDTAAKKENPIKTSRLSSHQLKPTKASSPATPRKRVFSDEHWVKDRKKGDGVTSAEPSSVDVKPPLKNRSKGVDPEVRDSPMSGTSAPRHRRNRREHSSAEEMADEPTPPKNELRSPRLRRTKRQIPQSRSPVLDGKDDDDSLLARRTPTPPPISKPRKRSIKLAEEPLKVSDWVDMEDIPKTKSRRHKSKTHHRNPSPRASPEPLAKEYDPEVHRSGRRPSDEEVEYPVIGPEDVEAEPLPHPTATRIAAWLSDTPDPFVDDQSVSAVERPDSIIHRAEEGSPEEDPRKWEDFSVQEDPRPRKTRSKKRDRKKPEKQVTFEEPETVDESPLPKSESDERVPDRAAPGPEERPHRASSPASPLTRWRRALKRPSKPRHPRMSSPPVRQTSAPADARASTPRVAEGASNHHSPPANHSKHSRNPLSRSSVDMDRQRHPVTAREDESVVTDAPIASIERPRPDSSKSEEVVVSAADDPEPMRDGIPELSHDRELPTVSTAFPMTQSSLSVPQPIVDMDGKSVRSVRSGHTSRSKLTSTSVDELMKELVEDESYYARELHTLVQGVVPVLLSCVLSKSDSAIAAGLYGTSAHANDPTFTRPIIEMGVTLERLKSLHKRIPLTNVDRLLRWAQGAHRVYEEYIDCWRLGFEDVIINLGPDSDAKEGYPADEQSLESTKASFKDEGMARNVAGDVVDDQGRRVDVAYLLKRPLVRLKRLSKVFKVLNCLKPSALAQEQETRYRGLFIRARERVRAEEARQDDEEAAGLNCTMARDLETLTPAVSVSIDPTRQVILRDIFSLHLRHTSGQALMCRVQLFLREDPPGEAKGGDLLICSLEDKGPHLLFPPIQKGLYSARTGDMAGEMVVMIRGVSSTGQEWREIFSLYTDEPWACRDWIESLGSNPMPPSIGRHQSFMDRSTIGPANDVARSAVESTVSKAESTSGISHGIDQAPRPSGSSVSSSIRDGKKPQRPALSTNSSLDKRSDASTPLIPQDLNEAMAQAGESFSARLRRNNARRLSKAPPTVSPSSKESLGSPLAGKDNTIMDARTRNEDKEISSAISPESSFQLNSGPSVGKERELRKSKPASSPEMTSPPRSPHSTQPRSPRSPSIVPGRPTAATAEDARGHTSHPPDTIQHGVSFGSEKVPQGPAGVLYATGSEKGELSSPTSPHHVLTTPQPAKRPPKLDPSPQSARHHSGRPISSPLRNQYEPSISSETNSEGGRLTTVIEESFSDSSSAEAPEDRNVRTATTQASPLPSPHPHPPPPQTTSGYENNIPSLAPSDSASQAPYRGVPSQPMQTTKAIASIYSWSNQKATWEKLHPDECSVVISAGLIEAFEMTAAHSSAEEEGDGTSTSPLTRGDVMPLVGQELTPLVSVARGTALDVSIKSPATVRSQLAAGSHIMFRSRNPRECEALNAAVRIAQWSNPTYIALQQARSRHTGSSYSGLRRRTSGRRTVWRGFHWRSRRRGRGAGSVRIQAGVSDRSALSSSAGPASAVSALRSDQQSMGPQHPSTPQSGVTGVGGSSGGMSGVSSPSVASSAWADSVTPSRALSGVEGSMSTSPGNDKCLFFERQGSQWRIRGKARIHIGLPPVGVPCGFDQHRILIRGKQGNTLFDRIMGRDEIRRDGRTGILLAIDQEACRPDGQPGAVGGVGLTRSKYLIRMKTETDANRIYGLVGRM